jgi:hypothetical protein
MKQSGVIAAIIFGACLIAYACQLNGRYQAFGTHDYRFLIDTRTGKTWGVQHAEGASRPFEGITELNPTKDRWEAR